MEYAKHATERIRDGVTELVREKIEEIERNRNRKRKSEIEIDR